MATTAEMLAQAWQSQRAADMTRAKQISRQILQSEPGNVDAMHLLGVSLHASGKLSEAVEQYQKVLRITQTRAEVYNDLGTALAMQNRLDEAIPAFQRVVELKPDFADGHSNLGNALRLRGRLREAIKHLQEAVRLKPDYLIAHQNLGLAQLDLGHPDQGIASLLQALRLAPNDGGVLAYLQRALQRHPEFPEAHNNLGNALFLADRQDEAVAAYREALRRKPTLAEAHSNLGNVLCKQGLLDEGVESYRQALLLRPNYPDAHNNLGCALKEKGDVVEAIECIQRARQLKPEEHTYHSTLLGTLNYHPHYDERAIREEHRRWDLEHALPLRKLGQSYPNDPQPERRLRIGYVSPDFSGHVVGRNIWPLMRNHDHSQFEIFLYANMIRGDLMTEQFQKSADHWCCVAGMPDEQLAEKIRQDGIDVLVDLTLHTEGNRLLAFARKPAPVQVTFAGYPGSTGLSAIDYRLTDPYLDPPGQHDAALGAEQPHRLPHSFWCYDPQSEEPAVAPLPARARGHVTFGCLNNFCKVNDGVLELWAQVLRAVPGSRLLLMSKPGSHCQRTIDFLAQQGIAPGRVEFCSSKPRLEYLALYHSVDIGLDTLPYNGHTTSLDSFWMGVPVITLIGKTVVGRAGLSQLSNLGLQELAASTPDDFVRLAVELAGDLPRLESLRSGLRDRMRRSPLMDAMGFARGIEQAYRSMWRTWCSAESGTRKQESAHRLLGGDAQKSAHAPQTGGAAAGVASDSKAPVRPRDERATLEPLFVEAGQHRQAGRWTDAEKIYRQILQADPGNVDASHLLGVSLHAAGKLAEAVEQYQKVLRITQKRADVYSDLGTALAMQNHLDEAIPAFQRVLELKPDYAEGHHNLGNAFRLRGRLREAITHYQEAVRLKPSYATAHHNLGLVLLDQGRPDQAINSLQQALQLVPQDAGALASLQRALQRHPEFPEAHNDLGTALTYAGRHDEAIASFREALRRKPTLVEAYSNLGTELCKKELLDEGIDCFRKALQLKPNFADAYNNLGIALGDQGKLGEAIECIQQARQLKPKDHTYHSALLATFNYHPHYDERAIREEQKRWDLKHALSLRNRQSFPNDPLPERRLRIGYVSPDFSGHVVGRNVWPLMRHHDHSQFEIFLFANMTHGDPMTERFQKCADHWSCIAGMPDEQVADRIRQDGIDILVDLALHTLGNRLLVLARKPAPVQVAFAGYPGSTGLSAIDYRLTDPYLDPPGQRDAALGAEQPHRLPHSFWCYDPESEVPAVAPLPARARGHVTFGCLNNFCKVNDGVLELWARVLRAVPGSRLLLLSKPGSHWQRTMDLMSQQGIAAGRVEFCTSKPRLEYLALYHSVDIGLDTLPYNGHTTSLDSFWMGVPVITLIGKTVVGRAGLSQLSNLGLQELAASTPDDFVRLAVDLAGDLPRLESLRRGLRDRMRQSPLMDATGFARGIEQAFRKMWRTWCSGESSTHRQGSPHRQLGAEALKNAPTPRAAEAAGGLPSDSKAPVQSSDDRATLEPLFVEAGKHREAGRWPEAERIYRQILQSKPGNVDAAHLLGVSLHAGGRLAEAVEQYRKVLRITQNRADVYNDLGTALGMQGRLDEAIPAFQRVLELQPDFAEGHHNLGNAFRLRGRLQEAITQYQECVRLKPSFATAHHDLGRVFLEQGRPDEAILSFQQALLLAPQDASVLGSLQGALQRYKGFPEAHNHVGTALFYAGRRAEAIASFREALRSKPDFAAAHSNLGNALCDEGLLEEGIESYRQALQLEPNFADAFNNLGNALGDQGKLDEAIDCLQKARKLKPQEQSYHSALLSTLNYHSGHDARAIREEHKQWEMNHALSLMKRDQGFPNEPNPERRLRIGYVSPDFRDHVIGRNIWPLLSHHDHSQFEVFLYANQTAGDLMTARLQKCADHWRGVFGDQDDQVVERIWQDGIDILVDLTLHLTSNRLLVFARKPAPIQVTFAGYPGTTGLSAIDYRLTDPYLDPPGQTDTSDLYAEESYRLPHSFWCYDPQSEQPAVAPLPAKERGYVTFGCLNNISKINDGVLELWAQVLRGVAQSRLLLQSKPGSHRQRILGFFAQRGVASDRIDFCISKPRPEYLALYNQVDIGLDTLPYNGHTTSLDSFWMGVPVISLIGKTVVGRAGLSQLTNLGLKELVASTPEEFVRRAVDLACDLPRLESLRSGLRERMRRSPLMDATGFARGIEQAYRNMWRKWCAGGSTNPRLETVHGFPGAEELKIARTLQAVGVAGGVPSDSNAPVRPQVERATLEPLFVQAGQHREAGRWREAEQIYRQILQAEPGDVDAAHMLGVTLHASGRLAEAVEQYQKVLRITSTRAEVYNDLGTALLSAGRHDEAIASYREAIRLKPGLAQAHSNLGYALGDQGLPDEGIACYRQAVLLDPNFAEAFNNLGSALGNQGKLDEAIECLQRARKLQPHEQSYHSAVLSTLNFHSGHDARAIREEHNQWEMNHALSLMKRDQVFSNEPVPERRLRIGYVSPDFRDHVIGRNIWPLLSHHDHSQFEVFLYANQTAGDLMTARLQKCADHWRGISGDKDDQVAERIRQDGIDILVDLTLHLTSNRILVFARKPAPIQVTFAGYPGSTGLSAIDYRLTDPYLDPPGQPQHRDLYAEESYRLPHSFWCYDPQSDQPAVGPLPAKERGYVNFGCLNNISKINDGVLELWAQVLRAVAESRLLLQGKPGSHRQRILDFLAQLGVASDRIGFCTSKPRPEYLALYNQVDIGLDTLPYNGHTTSLDSFWMGVPVITLIGNTVVGRAGLSQLTNLGLKELAASTPEEFVRLAVDLAGNLPRLESLRMGMRERMRQSVLMDAPGFARGIEQAYRTMWRKWCAKQSEHTQDKTRYEQLTKQGATLAKQGLLDEAIASFQEAVQLQPGDAKAHYNLGTALAHQDRYDEAVACLQRAIELNSAYPLARLNLGNVLRLQKRFEDAISHLHEAIRLKPNWSEAHCNLGIALQEQHPESADGHNEIGVGLAIAERLDEAIASYQQALKVDPNCAKAYNNLANAYKDQGRLQEAMVCYKQALKLKPEQHRCHSNLLCTFLYHPGYDEPALFEEHRLFEQQHAQPFASEIRAYNNVPSPERRLRIGYVSPDFRDHVVGRNVWPLVRIHDRSRFEVYLYANLTFSADSMTEKFQKHADHWRNIADVTDDGVAGRIRQDGINILVDLALHTNGNRLLIFARKPAPVQVTFAGYPGSTGLRAIDYRLTDPFLDPPGQSDTGLYAEESYRLPHSFWCYEPQTEEPAVAPLPALAKGYVTFGNLNNFCKVNEGSLELWARVLRAVPGSRLLLLTKPGSHRQRTLDFLARHGIAAGRVQFSSMKPRPEYLALYHQVDIGLDALPYNGHTSSLDSFWMGAPVITLIGKTVVGRAGLSQLTNLDLKELAATTPDDFVRLAVDLARDLPRLEGLRSGLRERMKQSPLMDATGFTRAIENAYLHMWRKWCAKQR